MKAGLPKKSQSCSSLWIHFNLTAIGFSFNQLTQSQAPNTSLVFFHDPCFSHRKTTTYGNSLVLFYGALFVSNKQITGSLIVEIALSDLWKPAIKCVLNLGQVGWLWPTQWKEWLISSTTEPQRGWRHKIQVSKKYSKFLNTFSSCHWVDSSEHGLYIVGKTRKCLPNLMWQS